MNGATAEPDTRTIRPLRKTSKTMIGTSQNFFRVFIKFQSSERNSPIFKPPFHQANLKLTLHVGRGASGARDLICRSVTFEISSHGITAGDTAYHSNRDDQHVIDDTQNDAAVYPAQRFTDGHPPTMK